MAKKTRVTNVSKASKAVTNLFKAELGKFSLKSGIKTALNFAHKHIMIRPRLRLASKAILVLTLALVASTQASKAIAEQKDHIVVNGHKILVAEPQFPVNSDAENSLDQKVEPARSPFEFHMPVDGYISQVFTYYHQGVDIAADYGKPVHSLGAGTVEYAGFMNDGHGITVVINHGNGLYSLYAHLSRVYVGVGNQIDTQHPIGAIGLTGRTTGAHVHVEVTDNGKLVDPQKLLPGGN